MTEPELLIELAADSTPADAKRVERLGQGMLQPGDEAAQLSAAKKVRLTAKA